ncbi:hypothetical protein KSF78_0008307 [Schistosoma japonicum]|nr:hypothetical protein KSF78_0008307 [Schistosoma japonicum]
MWHKVTSVFGSSDTTRKYVTLNLLINEWKTVCLQLT